MLIYDLKRTLQLSEIIIYIYDFLKLSSPDLEYDMSMHGYSVLILLKHPLLFIVNFSARKLSGGTILLSSLYIFFIVLFYLIP